MRLSPLRVLSLSSLALVAATASAKEIEVPDDHPTIQLAIDAAGPGDTIEVDGGTYFETVVIPSGKDGLRIEGKGKVILDVHPSQTPAKDAVVVVAHDVTIENLVVRHARGGWDGVRVLGDRLRLEKVVVEDVQDWAVQLLPGAVDLEMKDCRITDARYGVYASSAGKVRIDDCTFQHVEHRTIDVRSSDLRVDDCKFQACEDPIRAVDGPAKITDNEIVGFTGSGIEVATSTAAFVGKNEVRSGAPGSRGIDLSYASGAKVDDNELVDVAGDAILVRGSSAVKVDDNEVVRAGGRGIVLESSSECTVTDNSVKNGVMDGVLLLGAYDCLVADNSIKACLRDGIRFLGGAGNQAIDNQVRKNGGEGLCNTGSGAVWRENSAKGNRIDLANSGSVTVKSNSYKSGGPNVKPQVED